MIEVEGKNQALNLIDLELFLKREMRSFLLSASWGIELIAFKNDALMKKTAILTLFILTGLVHGGDFTHERLENWPQWRGPLANGTAPRGDPPLHWDDTANIKWIAALPGRGSATPIVWGDQVFVLTAIDTGRQAKPEDLPTPDPKFPVKTKPPTTYHQFVVVCYDRANGKERWRRIAAEAVPHEGHHDTHSYAAYSPTADGKYLYALFGSRGVYCYDLTGKLIWKRDLGLLHTRLGWGEGGSPALYGDSLVVNMDQEAGSFFACLDAKTGEVRWRIDRDEVTTWATPLIVEHKGRTQVIVPGTKHVRSYDLKDGKLIWTGGPMTVNCIPSSVAANGVVYVMSGYQGAMAYAISLNATGDVGDKQLWKATRGTPYVPSPLLAGGRLYFTQANEPLLTCLDIKTGKALIDRVRLPELTSLYASPVCAAGRIYITGRDGTTLVLKESDTFELLATNRLDDPIDASPAIVGKQIFLRGAKYLYCIEQK
jgi:outer membrane protein assembly factor BamB